VKERLFFRDRIWAGRRGIRITHRRARIESNIGILSCPSILAQFWKIRIVPTIKKAPTIGAIGVFTREVRKS
jgi:hypothetical protein